MDRQKIIGRCALTGHAGQFVKSHIIPRALAKPRSHGDAFAQIGQRRRPTRRRDSWYDPQLVIAEGEATLAGLDAWAIKELRRLKLVWQSWGPMIQLTTSDFIQFPGDTHGIRTVEFSDPARMRRFLLSVLWRAAATSLREFEEVTIRASEMRKIRQIVRGDAEARDDFFPVTMTQISTMGLEHNFAAIAQTKYIPSIAGSKERHEPIFRFYFDGLAVHFHTNPSAQTMDGIEPMRVGRIGPTAIPTVTFEASWERLNLAYCILDAEHEFPGALKRAEGRQRPGD